MSIEEMEVLETPRAIQQEIVVSDTGVVTKSKPQVNWTDKPAYNSKLAMIREKISDPTYDPSEVSRWIAEEIAAITELMVTGPMNMTDDFRVKGLNGSIKALRELGKQLNESEVLNKKDVLNFDGKKFEYVLGFIVDLFNQAMKESGVADDMRVSVMKQYRDLMSTNEETIRRETQKLDSNKK
jgi:hypothetical protein